MPKGANVHLPWLR